MIDDCASFLALLEEWLDGRLAGVERDRAERHLAGCAECRELTKLSRAAEDPAFPDAGEALTSAILGRTCGSPCDSARERLGDHVDGALLPIDATLVRSHLASCRACSALARTLVRLGRELPALAELQPDRAFVADVLGRTSRGAPRTERWPQRLLEALRAFSSRPRFALEGAYLGTALLALLFAFPSSPLVGATRRVIGLTSQNPVAVLEGPTDRLTDEIRSAWDSSGRRWIESARSNADEFADRSTATIDKIRGDLGTLVERLTSELENHDDDTSPAGDATAEGETR